MTYVDKITDSIWYAQGNENPFVNYFDENGNILDEQEFEENGDTPLDFFPDASDDPNVKNYYELRDSVESNIQKNQLKVVLEQLFEKGVSLTSTDKHFAEQIQHSSEGIFLWITQEILIRQTVFGIFKLYCHHFIKIFEKYMMGILF